MSKKKRNILIALTVVLGAAMGFIIVYGASLGSLLAALYGGETAFGVIAAIIIAAGFSIPLGFLHNKIYEKLHVPHWVLIVITCIVPAAYSVWYRADFLHKKSHGGFDGFMGGLGQSINDWCSLAFILLSIGFTAARIASVCIINHSVKSKKSDN